MATNLLVWWNIKTRSDTMLGAVSVLCSGCFLSECGAADGAAVRPDGCLLAMYDDYGLVKGPGNKA
jgi:hypothetical protein